jgi:hypothetical protein
MKMKKIIIILFFLNCITFGLHAQETQSSTNDSIVFDYVRYDFGTITQGSNGSCQFTFTNKGTSPLILNTVKASCGCTYVKWPKKPIMPGQKGVIKVKYDTNNIGAFSKNITVKSNAVNSTVYLFISGGVIFKQ